jgi:hypothetical protein
MTHGSSLATYTLELAPELLAHLECVIFDPDTATGYPGDWELHTISLWYAGALLDTGPRDWIVRQLREQAETCALQGFDDWLCEEMREARKGAA